MSNELVLINSDIDLTERNDFGRSRNEFKVELDTPRSVVSEVLHGKTQRPKMNPYQTFRSVSSYYRSWANTSTTTSGNISLHYTYSSDGYYTNIDFDACEICNKVCAGLEEFMKTKNMEILAAIKHYVDILRQYGSITVVNYKLYYVDKTACVSYIRYDTDTIGGNSTWSSTRSTIYDNDYYPETISITPPIAARLATYHIERYMNNPNDIFPNCNGEYIEDMDTWCNIITLFGYTPNDYPPVSSRRSLLRIEDGTLRDRLPKAFYTEFDEIRDSYNAIEDTRSLSRYGYDYAKKMRIAYSITDDDDTSSLSGLRSYANKRRTRLGGDNGRSEYPDIIITNNGVTLSYADWYVPTRYEDNGLHLIQKINPTYDTIEYDLKTMSAYEYDNHRGRRHPRSHLRMGEIIDKEFKWRKNK